MKIKAPTKEGDAMKRQRSRVATFAASMLVIALLMGSGSALAAGGFFSSLSQFIGYGLGMASIMILLTLGIALFKEGIVVSGLAKTLPYVERAAAVLLLVAGGYIVYYWFFKAGLIRAFA